jgi:hypothetical protein
MQQVYMLFSVTMYVFLQILEHACENGGFRVEACGLFFRLLRGCYVTVAVCVFFRKTTILTSMLHYLKKNVHHNQKTTYMYACCIPVWHPQSEHKNYN